MKKIFLLVFIYLFQNHFIQAQVAFQNGYGDTITDKGNVIITTSTGGYCIVGPSGQNYTDSSDIAVYMINNVGDLVLSVKIGLPGDEIPTGLVETDNGDFIISGTTYASPLDTVNSDIFAVRITPLAGFVIWSNVYGGLGNDEANSLIRTPEGNFLIIGSTTSFDSTMKSGLALRIDESGNQQWCSVSGALKNNFFSSADISYDFNYLLAGSTYDSTRIDNYIVKIDTSGNVMWGRRFGTAGFDCINAVRSVSDSSFVLAGINGGITSGDTNQSIIRIDSSGNVIWAKNYGTVNADVASSLVVTPYHSYITCGYSTVISPGGPLNQMVINETDSSGNVLWANTYGTLSDATEGYNIFYGADGGFAATGFSNGFSEPNGDVYLVKTGINGASTCFEFPITFSMNASSTTDSIGSSSSFITLGDSSVAYIGNPYINQYSQNCFFNTISSNAYSENVNIYPNPANDYLNIETDYINPVVTMFDLRGSIISEYKLSKYYSTVDISGLLPGVYFLEISADNNFTVKRFIKN